MSSRFSRTDKRGTTTISSRASYLGAAGVTIDALTAITASIPFASAIGIAKQIIALAEEVQSNRDDAEDLINRICALMVVVASQLKETDAAMGSSDLDKSVERLSKDLAGIEEDLKRIQKTATPKGFLSMARVRSIVASKSIAAQLKDCTSKLDWAMRVFEVEGRLESAIRLLTISEDVKAVHAEVSKIRDAVEDLGISNEAKVFSGLASTVIPPQPELFYGREDDVEDIMTRVLGAPGGRFAINGPGGIGKTSVALAVMHHDRIIQHFIHRSWVRCDEAITVSLFLDLLARSVGVEKFNKDRLKDIMDILRNDRGPRLLLLDNLETTLDIEGRQSDVEDILCTISSIKSLTLIVTIRGTRPAADRIRWTKPFLESLRTLSPEAARELYTELDPDAEEDENLGELLSQMDHMPLAVKLMANVGALGESPTELLKRWNEAGTTMITGNDRRTSIEKSILFSIQSQHMEGNDKAINLLSALAYLPLGGQPDFVSSLKPELQDPGAARVSLLRAALVYTVPGSKRVLMLSPVRAYVRRYYPASSLLFEGVFRYYHILLENILPMFTPTDDATGYFALSQEQANMDSVLLTAMNWEGGPKEDDRAVESIRLAHWVQEVMRTNGSFELATTAVKTARRIPSSHLLPNTLLTLGTMHMQHGVFSKARPILEESKVEFEKQGHVWGWSGVLKILGEIEWKAENDDLARKHLTDGLKGFEAVDDPSGIARCVELTGYLDVRAGDWKQGQVMWTRAAEEYERAGNIWMAFMCEACIPQAPDLARRHLLIKEGKDPWEGRGPRAPWKVERSQDEPSTSDKKDGKKGDSTAEYDPYSAKRLATLPGAAASVEAAYMTEPTFGCDGCEKSLETVRYHCIDPACGNYDLCVDCMAIEDVHEKGHEFVKYTR